MGCGSSLEAAEPSKLNSNGTTNGVTSRIRMEKVERIELTEGVVQQYVQLEQEIHRLEIKDVVRKCDEKILVADGLKKTVDQLEATCKELKKQTEKKKTDVDNLEQPSVRTFLKQQGTYDEKLKKEQREYQEAFGRQEIAEKELGDSKAQYDRASKIADIHKRRTDKLNELYDKEDHLLAGIFDGQYGSETENKLEQELDVALEWHQRVSLAKFKWTNGRVLLVHANTQMAFGVKRWQELEAIELSNTRARYFAAAEARNNFIAASQNVQSCRVYLGKVQFPYCTEEEMAQMDKAINGAFTDIQTNDRYAASLQVFQSVHRSVSSLIQWFDQVINETILKDLQKASEDLSRVQKDLRAERLQLMKELVKEKLGHELVIAYDNNVPDDDDEKELLLLESQKNNLKPSGDKLRNILTLTQPEGPVGQLAPVPSNEALFGNVATIRKQYEHEVKELEKQQVLTKAKMDQGLQEKLRQRRNRKDRRKSLKFNMITETINPK